jgi:hypothetical protein
MSPIEGGLVDKLNDLLVSGGNVSTFNISPNSVNVVYKADQDTDGVREVYWAHITGGGSTRLNSDLATGGGVIDFEITPNSQTVVYRAEQDDANIQELHSVWNPVVEKRDLYAVPIVGGDQVPLTAMPDGRGAHFFEILPNNLGVIYTADPVMEAIYELYLVSIFGGRSYQLNGPLVDRGSVFSFAITSDSLKVVYTADQETNDKIELFVAFEGFGVYLPAVKR